MRILIIGHFGKRNIGDEIILLSQMQILTKKFGECEFVVYTYDKVFTSQIYKKYNYKIETIQAFGLRNSLISTVEQFKKIKDIDFAILGGGGIIQDIYFSYGILRYLLPVYICLLKNIPFYTFAIGVYKFNYSLNRSLFDFILKHAHGISVRDEVSAKNIKNINPNIKVYEILDAALMFDTTYLENTILNNNSLTLVFRDFFEPYLDDIQSLILKLKENNHFDKINLIVFENNQVEIDLANKMSNILSSNFKVDVYNDIDPINYLNLLNQSSIVVTGRLHGLLPSLILKKTLVCMSYAPKIESFCDKNSIPYLKFDDLKNIKNINLNTYVFNTSKTNVLGNLHIETTTMFIDKIKNTYKNKNKINLFKKVFILSKLFFYGNILIFIHIFNKLSNKKIDKES